MSDAPVAPSLLLFSLGRNGGLPKYASHVAAGLQEKGRPFLAVCARVSEHPVPGARRVPTYSGMATLLLSSLTVLPLLLLWMLAVIVRYRIRCVYFPYVHTWTPVISACARLLGVRVVVTFHDYSPHLGEDGLLTRLVLRGSEVFASRFVFLSGRVLSEAIKKRPVLASRSVVVPHGLFSLPGLQEKAPENLREDVSSVLFLGRISRYKGVEMLVGAFSRSGLSGKAKLIVAGKANYGIDASLFGPCMELMDEYLDEVDMARLLNEADLVVLPYLEATQSGVVTLAVDSATPMIVTNVGGMAEQLSVDEAIFSEPDEASLCAALEEVRLLAVRKSLCGALRLKKASLEWPVLADSIYRFCVPAGPGETKR